MTKSSISHNTLTAPLSVAVLLASCVNTLELVAPQGEGRVMSHEGAVADAKAYFDTHCGQNTRSNNQAPTEEAPYVVGNLVYRGEGVDVLLHELLTAIGEKCDDYGKD